MERIFKTAAGFSMALVLAACGGGGGGSSQVSAEDRAASDQNMVALAFADHDSNGVTATWSAGGKIDRGNPFFQPAGNGRSCASCHSVADGWSLTPESVRTRFDMSQGSDPLFMPHDGANSPLSDVSTQQARESAYSLLLSKALIRIGMPVPAGEFELAAADDPYRFASSAELSLFRRPLPTTNLRFVANVMWDGRETPVDPQSSLCVLLTGSCFRSTPASLASQAIGASRSHHQMAAGLSAADLDAIVQFESGLFTARQSTAAAGDLTGAGARGGTGWLATLNYYFGINNFDSGDYRTGAPFTTNVFTAFDAWSGNAASLADPGISGSAAIAQTEARRSVARGQAIFNGRPMFINNVPGMRSASIRGSCTSCHDAPNAGSSSTPLLVNIGTADGSRRTADLPLYTLRNSQTAQTVQVTDPGAAMTSGRWDDIGKFKVPVLRGIGARPPYFHNGSAADLRAVVEFYNERFAMSLSEQDMTDLTAFLSSL